MECVHVIDCLQTTTSTYFPFSHVSVHKHRGSLAFVGTGPTCLPNPSNSNWHELNTFGYFTVNKSESLNSPVLAGKTSEHSNYLSSLVSLGHGMSGNVHSRPNVAQGPAEVGSVMCRKREMLHSLPPASAIWTHNLLVILPLVLSTGIPSLQTILGKMGKQAPMSLGPTSGVTKLFMPIQTYVYIYIYLFIYL